MSSLKTVGVEGKPRLFVNRGESDLLLDPGPEEPVEDFSPNAGERFAFNLAFLRRFGLLFKLYLARSLWHWACILSILICSVMYSTVSSKIGDQYGEFYTVVTKNHTSLDAFRDVIIGLGFTMVAQAVVQTCIVSSARALAVHVRRLVTDNLHALYYDDRNYYKLSRLEEFKNPDQRMTQDVEKFAKSYTDVLQKVIASPVFVVYFWFRVAKMLHWTAPLCMVVYYVLGYLVQRFVMSPIVHHVYIQERLEGEFRRVHVTQHTHAEAIAMYRGDEVEKRLSSRAFEKVLGNSVTIVKWEWFLTCPSPFLSDSCFNLTHLSPFLVLSYLFSYIGTLMGYLVVAFPLIFNWAHVLESNYVTTGLYDLGMLAWGFTQLTLVTADLSEFAGYCSRVGLLVENLISMESTPEPAEMTTLNDAELGSQRVRVVSPQEGLSLTKVTIFDPAGNTLLKDIDFKLTLNTLLMGSAGTGKTSLFRVISGLWNDFRGTIEVSPNVMFIPQDVYLPFASLRQQIAYPHLLRANSNRYPWQMIRQVLLSLSLESVLALPNLEKITDWTFLSPGQRQKIVMARVLIQQPRFVLLDEISSNVDAVCEKTFYELCRKKDIRVLSIGHRSSLRQFHDVVYEIEDSKLKQQ